MIIPYNNPSAASVLNSLGGSIGGRNRLLNGDKRIDQANAGAAASVAVAGPVYSVDKWKGYGTAATGVYSLQQQTATPPAGFSHYLRATVTTADAAPAAGSTYYCEQSIEGFYCVDFDFGKATAISVTYSFWARSSLTGSFSGAVVNSASNRSYPFSFTMLAANTWEYKTVTITGDITGTWLVNSGIGLRLRLDFGSGTTFKGTANAWSASNFNGVTGSANLIATNAATFDWTATQLELGTAATPFEQKPFGDMLRLCQREFLTSFRSGTAPAQNIGINTGETRWNALFAAALSQRGYVSLPVSMRAIPASVILFNPAAANAQIRDESGSVDCSASSFSAQSESRLEFTGTGNAATVFGNILGIHYTADARL